MRPILEVNYRNVDKTPQLENLIEEKLAKLREVCGDLVSCRVSLEKPQQHQRVGNPFRVRLDLKVPGREVVTVRESSEGDMHDPLPKVIRDAFAAARRQLKEYRKKKQGEVKVHLEQNVQAVVARVFPGEGYGFLQTPEGREIYFHRHSVQGGDFEELKTGTGVRFEEEMGDKGPQATMVHILRRPVREPSQVRKLDFRHRGTGKEV